MNKFKLQQYVLIINKDFSYRPFKVRCSPDIGEGHRGTNQLCSNPQTHNREHKVHMRRGTVRTGKYNILNSTINLLFLYSHCFQFWTLQILFFFFLHLLRTDSSGASVTLNEKRAWSLASTCTAQSYLHLQKTGCIYTISPTFFCAPTCTKTQLHIFMCFFSLKQLNKSDYRK